MAKITVVTAFNPKNAGMYSVDLAAEQFLQSLGHSTRLVRTQARKSWLKPRFGRQRFEVVRNPDRLFADDILLYWGDFTTNVLYGLNDFVIRDVGLKYTNSQDVAFENWMRLFLPVRPNQSTAVYSIGQNFHSLDHSLRLLSEEKRERVIERYGKTFDAIIPRDDMSLLSFNALNFENSQIKTVQGLDPAMLLDHSVLYPRLKSMKQSNTFAYVFGRSGFHHIPELLNELEEKSGLQGIDLPFWHRLDAAKADRQMQRMMETIASSKFVLTDTYHCAINALTFGKPVFCLGVTQPIQKATVSEPKKQILFRMMGLLENYLEFINQNLPEADRKKIIETIMMRMAGQPSDPKFITNLISNFCGTVVATLESGQKKW